MMHRLVRRSAVLHRRVGAAAGTHSAVWLSSVSRAIQLLPQHNDIQANLSATSFAKYSMPCQRFASSSAAAPRPQAGGRRPLPRRRVTPPRAQQRPVKGDDNDGHHRRQGEERQQVQRNDSMRRNMQNQEGNFYDNLQEEQYSPRQQSNDRRQARHGRGHGREHGRHGRGHERTQQHRSKLSTPRKRAPPPPPPRPIATSPWICLTNIPQLSLLEDVADTMARVMQYELERGIVDLDEAERLVQEQEDGNQEQVDDAVVESLPLWTPPDDTTVDLEGTHILLGSFIQEARLMLSILGRPCGWYLRFPSRSCVQAILSHADEAIQQKRPTAICCGGKTLQLGEFAPPAPPLPNSDGNSSNTPGGKILFGTFGPDTSRIESSFNRAVDLRLDDSVIWVENCPAQSDVEDIRYLFRRFDIIDTRRLQDDDSLEPVELLIKGNYRKPRGGQNKRPPEGQAPISTNTFIVRFETPADARAAIRDMQMVEFKDRTLRLAQYPRQMLV